MTAERSRWAVWAGSGVSEHSTEAAAIEAAKKFAAQYGHHCQPVVIRTTQSGRYRSRQQVWPTVGPINTF